MRSTLLLLAAAAGATTVEVRFTADFDQPVTSTSSTSCRGGAYRAHALNAASSADALLRIEGGGVAKACGTDERCAQVFAAMGYDGWALNADDIASSSLNTFITNVGSKPVASNYASSYTTTFADLGGAVLLALVDGGLPYHQGLEVGWADALAAGASLDDIVVLCVSGISNDYAHFASNAVDAVRKIAEYNTEVDIVIATGILGLSSTEWLNNHLGQKVLIVNADADASVARFTFDMDAGSPSSSATSSAISCTSSYDTFVKEERHGRARKRPRGGRAQIRAELVESCVEINQLFHGCGPDVVDKILQQGFNRSFCGKNATFYGKGVYFARDASYSTYPLYSPADGRGLQTIFAVRVVVGAWSKGVKDALTPDVRDARRNLLYDTTVDNMADPSIFVTYHDAQAYPEYRIRFTQSNPAQGHPQAGQKRPAGYKPNLLEGVEDVKPRASSIDAQPQQQQQQQQPQRVAPAPVPQPVAQPVAQRQQFMVQIPAGVAPGAVMTVRAPDGRLLQVQVPAGAVPGSTIQVAA